MSTQNISLPIMGMNCSACASRLEKSLHKMETVVSASVNFALEKAILELKTETPLETILKQVRLTGFEVATETHKFTLSGSTSPRATKDLINTLKATKGVIDVSSSTAEMTVVGVAKLINKKQLLEIACGSGLSEAVPGRRQNKIELSLKSWNIAFVKVVCGLILTFPFFVMMVFNHLEIDWGDAIWFPPIVQGILASIILIFLGGNFFKGSYFALRNRSANMEVLVVLGSTVACVFSWYQLFTSAQAEHYFETTAFIITFVLIGKYLENRAKTRVADAISDLMALQPDKALLVLKNGETRELPVENIRVGDVLLCKAGQQIPVDGLVTKGSSEVDGAMISGESLPVLKSKGDRVTAGSITCDGLIHVEAQAIGEEATLAKMIRFIEEAHARKAKIYPLVDKISNIFVPAVLLLALFSLIFWFVAGAGFENSLINGVSVLVIACPCALGLATPTAIMAGTSLAAKNGILIRDSETLQKVRSLTHVIFDKTGTLTTGHPKVDKAMSVSNDYSVSQIIAIAASLQQGSQHPIAVAIQNEADNRQCSLQEIENFRNHVGLGVEGELSNSRYLLGSTNLFRKFGFEVDSKQFDDWYPQVILGKFEDSGVTILGGMTIHDEIRPHSSEGVKLLKDEGLEVMILSGDKAGIVQRIAQLTGIRNYRGNADPVAKIKEIEQLGDEGHLVGMVGDGINDSPALAHAHVGIAMGSGADVAMNSSGIILMKPDPRLVASSIAISRLTFRKIKQNLFWAFIYNVVALPLAALGFLNPGLAAGAMALSSLSVVSNSLLLKLWQRKYL